MDLAYGIKKLQIMCVVEDEKVSVEDLREDIEKFEDLVSLIACGSNFSLIIFNHLAHVMHHTLFSVTGLYNPI